MGRVPEASPPSNAEPLTVKEAVRMLVGFLKGLLITATLYTIASLGWHWLMGVPLFWLTGLLAGLLYAVPYVGMLVVVLIASGSVVVMGAPMPFLSEGSC